MHGGPQTIEGGCPRETVKEVDVVTEVIHCGLCTPCSWSAVVALMRAMLFTLLVEDQNAVEEEQKRVSVAF